MMSQLGKPIYTIWALVHEQYSAPPHEYCDVKDVNKGATPQNYIIRPHQVICVVYVFISERVYECVTVRHGLVIKPMVTLCYCCLSPLLKTIAREFS